MKNKTFQLLPIEEKQVKLRTTLSNKTEGHLSEHELDRILSQLNLDQQYYVKVYRDITKYSKACVPELGMVRQVGAYQDEDRISVILTKYPGQPDCLHILIPADHCKPSAPCEPESTAHFSELSDNEKGRCPQ